MKEKWNEICKDQKEIGIDYRTRQRNLEALYQEEMIETNSRLIFLLKEMAREKNQNLTIVRVEYYNVYGQSCDVDALWLSTEPVKITNRVSLFDNVVHGRGKFDGVVKKIYHVPVDERREYNTLACPLNHRKMWSAEEMR